MICRQSAPPLKKRTIIETNAWWTRHREQFPHLYMLALRILAAPRTSVFQEFVFSYTGHDTEGKRCNMKQKRLNIRQFIRFNYLALEDHELMGTPSDIALICS